MFVNQCPKCKSTYHEDYETCWDCKTALEMVEYQLTGPYIKNAKPIDIASDKIREFIGGIFWYGFLAIIICGAIAGICALPVPTLLVIIIILLLFK